MRRSQPALLASSDFLTTTFSLPFSRTFYLGSLIACLLAIASPLLAQQTTPLVTQPVDNSVRTILPGNVHPLARAQYDQGEAPPDLALNRLLLVLKRSDQQETTLRRLIENQQNKKSSSYHRWLTPEQFGAQYGPADSDIAAVTNWLQQSGFQVTQISNGRTMIEFSGTAGQVKQAFGTAIHKYVVNGESHWANVNDPSIPTALAPVIAGVNKLNSFRKKAQYIHAGTYNEKTKQLTSRSPNFDTTLQGDAFYAVSPFDFATIYDLLPLWNNTINGANQTIAIVGDSDIYQGDPTSNPPIPSDAANFWGMFGLGANGVPMPTLQVTYNGPNPGFNGDESEADIDTQWAGSVAPGATINYVASQDTETDDGVDLSALYIIDNNVAPVMSESFGICEAELGSVGVAFYQILWEQAAAQGITAMVSTGDSGSANCDDPNTENAAQYGLAVNGIASTAFNVAVGGTDFNQFNKQSTYWNSTNNPNTQQSVMTGIYIPETTWNDSCTNLLLQFLPGGTTNPEGNCNNAKFQPDFLDIVGGGGGASGEVNLGYGTTKPTWQTGPGVPNDNARDLPDVSLFASNGFVGSLYVFCESDLNTPAGCDLTDLQGAGGTSFSSPAFAGIMALVNQQNGPQGIANLVLYNLSAKQPNAFHDIPAGSTIAMPCVTGSPQCTTNTSGDAYGVLSGFSTTTAYDQATGLGSVDAANLVNNWNKVTFTPTKTTLTLNSGNPVSITHGSSVPLVIGVGPTSGSGTPTGDVAILVAPGTPGNPGIDGFTLSGGTTGSVATNLLPGSSSFPGGTYQLIAHYEGDTTYGGSYSSPSAGITVNPEGSSVVMPGVDVGLDQNTGNIVYSTSVVYGTGGFDLYWLRADVLNSQGNYCQPAAYLGGEIGCPTGTMTFNGDTNPVPYSATLNLNSLGYTEDQSIQLAGGSHTLVANYSGDASYNPSSTTAVVTVAQAPTLINNVSAPGTANVGAQFTVTATVSTTTSTNTSYGLAPTGTVQFFANGNLLGTAQTTPTNGNINASPAIPASLAATLTASLSTAGKYTITATYSGDTNYVGTTSTNSSSITVSAPAPFTIGSIASVTIPAPGDSGTAQVTLTQANGFTGAVTFTCTTPAAMLEASCSAPGVTISSASPVTATVTITTTGPHQIAAIRPAATGLLAFGVLAGIFVFTIPGLRRTRAPLTLLLFGLVILIASCGGSSGSGTHTDPGTPTGTYTISLTATGNSVAVPASFSVTVQ